MNVRQVIPRDAIPSIDEPEFARTYAGAADDEVLVLESSPPRAYPVRILDYHEIVNDDLGNDPVAVTWCPLCGSAVVYERVVDGRTLTFGVSGKLADDDLVMYDRETGSEWKQSLGTAIAGELEGERLAVRPAAMLPWEDFRERYPDGVVLQPTDADSEAASDDDEPAPIDYDERPYEAYFERDGFGLDAHRGGESQSRAWDRDDLEPKAVVLGLERGGEAVGFPLPWLEAAGGVSRATVGDTDVVVFATDAGLHAFEDPGLAFEPAGSSTFAADGTTWDGATGESKDGRTLERIPARRLFAFAWQDDHGPDAFVEGGTRSIGRRRRSSSERPRHR
ncbi:DUF3179 domain-containing protein [Natronobeatus ordinarius]|uniref:DUF3179 domain-containing protein n=1 Tax=Natronobeatus ordinarius TaxID=2963433 RepID=UPI0020CE3C95|nr:DUF3179 domain-containing protein [Natronobeatus ordinarius]